VSLYPRRGGKRGKGGAKVKGGETIQDVWRKTVNTYDYDDNVLM